MKVIVATTQREILDNVLVRGKVFIVEQKIDWEIEFDGLDQDSILFTAYKDRVPVGAARLYKNKVGRVATLKEYRKQGIAKAIMKQIESYCKSHNILTVKLHAQLPVKEFYLKLDYIAKGNIFYEADIPHVYMEKTL